MIFLKKRRRRIDLDDALDYWSPSDPFTARHACQNTLICGKTGSGKSSGSLDWLLRAIIRYWSGGLWLGAKAEDKAYAIRLFSEAGRLSDLCIMEPGGQYRFNLLSHLQKSGAKTPELTQALLILGETLDRMEGGGNGTSEPFFKAKNREGLNHAIEIVTRATGKLDPWDLQCFIDSAAISLEELVDPRWQQSYHNQLLERARANAKTDIEKHDHEASRLHWTSSWPRLNDRTRTSVEAGILSILNVFNSGEIRDLLATTTNISPDSLEERKWWFVNMPITPGDANAVFVNTAVKFAIERHTLRRAVADDSPLLAIVSDEFQNCANLYDRAFVEACRSRRGFLIAACQSLHALYAKLHGHGGDHQTNALVTNFGQIIAHTVGDALTAKHLSSILGMRRELFIGTTLQPGQEYLYDVLMGRSQVSVNCNEQWQPVIQPSVFLSGLRCGGPENGNIVDGVVLRTGQPFNHSGENHLIRSFAQR